ncbi:MAG TPA: hypothetical protein VE967_02440 [Gemmatimonadaceae bacterium]|nr:hypothetical protein [Gemmatimonadaceae bacterium]
MRVGAAMFALLVAANVASAQGGGGGGGGGGMGRGGPAGQRTADALLKDITLTDAQKGKVAEIVKWYDDESAKLPQMGRNSGADSATMAKARADRQKLTTDFQAKLKAELTPDQQKTFDANVAARAAMGGGRRGGGE